MSTTTLKKLQNINDYETVYILKPDLTASSIMEDIQKYQSLLLEKGADKFIIQNRGKCELVNPINKFTSGVYVQMNYKAEGNIINLLEKALRLNENVLRFMTIKK
uniref:Ribosomal protein S6 n=1 Tax=Glaucocystis sp. BBH TaxID=2023628 RepID=A0A3G1IV32_9EUKA|nr:ribosomal protein S6 [Glaucocystis sp. BBH]